MSEAERLRAMLAGSASVGSGTGQTLAGDPLRGILRAVDTTILPRTLSFAAAETGVEPSCAGVLGLRVAERRLVALVGSAPAGLAPEDAAMFGVELAFDDRETLTRVARVLATWVAAVGDGSVRMVETPDCDGTERVGASGTGTGLAATALARALNCVVWPDRSLPARLEAWMPVAWHHAKGGAGFGALSGVGLSQGDAAAEDALNEAVQRLAPGGLPTALTRGLATGCLAGFVALVDESGQVLVIAGSAEAGLAVLVNDEALPGLVRAWQQG